MIKKTLAAVLLAATSVMAAPVNAVVITFDDLGGPTVKWVHPLVTNHVVFFNTNDTDRSLGIWGDDNSNINADPDGYTLFNGYGGTTTIVHKDDGGTFDLYSIDLADVFDSNFYGEGGDILFSFIYYGGATSSQTVTIDALPGLQTFYFNQKGLSDFSYTPQTPLGSIQIDNVVIDQLGNATVDQLGVPEPATWAMMIGGFGLVGGAMRRRRSAGKLAAA